VLRRSRISGIHPKILLINDIFVIIYNYKNVINKQNFRINFSQVLPVKDGHELIKSIHSNLFKESYFLKFKKNFKKIIKIISKHLPKIFYYLIRESCFPNVFEKYQSLSIQYYNKKNPLSLSSILSRLPTLNPFFFL
jgi:hypothetical protein